MAVHAFYRLYSKHSFILIISLILCWCCGMFLGCSLYEPLPLSMMRSAVCTPVSIVGVFVCVFLPLLCTYFSFISERPIIILIVCMLKATAYGYSANLIHVCFSTAGWLVRLLFLFSDSCLMVLLLFLWIYHFSGNYKGAVYRLYLCGLLSTVVVASDVYVIHPFLERLF